MDRRVRLLAIVLGTAFALTACAESQPGGTDLERDVAENLENASRGSVHVVQLSDFVAGDWDAAEVVATEFPVRNGAATVMLPGFSTVKPQYSDGIGAAPRRVHGARGLAWVATLTWTYR